MNLRAHEWTTPFARTDGQPSDQAFGANPERIAEALRKLADEIEARRALVLDVETSETACMSEWARVSLKVTLSLRNG